MKVRTMIVGASVPRPGPEFEVAPATVDEAKAAAWARLGASGGAKVRALNVQLDRDGTPSLLAYVEKAS